MPRDQMVLLLGAAPDTERKTVVLVLIVASFLFVEVSIAIMMMVVWLVRNSFWKNAAQLGPHKWRTYLLQLPLGAPEGRIRVLLSLFVLVFGFVVIAIQHYLNIGNSEAIAGGLSAR